MPILTRMLASPLHVDIRSGAVAELGTLLRDRFISPSGNVLVAVGPSTGEALWEALRPTIPEASPFLVDSATLATAGKLQEALGERAYDAVVGIGGGRTLDVAKYAATRTGLPMVAVATNLAHDGICSPVASLENRQGKGSYGVSMPLAVVVDLDYVRAAPERMIQGGIGDVLSNLSAISDWMLAHRVHGEPVDGLSVALAQTAAEAVLHRTDSFRGDDFLVVLAQSLVISGMAMSVAGSSRPCSGACHEFIHAVDQLYPGVADHGELAGVGALFATFLREEDDDLFEQLARALAVHGLPRTPTDLGLDREQFVAAVTFAPETRPGRYTILEHLDLDDQAVRQRADAFHERLSEC